MSRPIKFRAWDTELKQFLYHKLGERHWYTADNRAVLFDHDDHHETAFKTGRLRDPQEFTGLHDKNGKEIYEGDILEYYMGSYWNVVYSEDSFCRELIGGRYPRKKQLGIDLFEFEVIGNVHENPELIP